MLPACVSTLGFEHVCVSNCSCRRQGSNLSPLTLTDFLICLICLICLIVCLFVLPCMCSSFRATSISRSVRSCMTSRHVYSQRSKWTRYFPPRGVDIGLSAGNSAFSPLVHSSELFKQEALGRKSGSRAFVNKAGSIARQDRDNCLEFPFYPSHLTIWNVAYSL